MMKALCSVLAFALVGCSSSSTSTPAATDGGSTSAEGGGGGTDAGASAVPGAALSYTVNGTAVVADMNVGANPGNGMDHITLKGDHFDAATSKTHSVTINLYNTTGTGTFKCSDNLDAITTKQWTNFTYNNTLINTPDTSNPTGPRKITGDCLVTVTGWATKSGEHYIGTFSTSGVPMVDITNGAFDLTRP